MSEVAPSVEPKITRDQVRDVTWRQMMDELLNREGRMTNTYSRFPYHSVGNRILLAMQGVAEPYGTVKQWNSLDRRVIKGSKAKAILRPIFRTEEDPDTGDERQRRSGFKLVNCMFTVSETEGADVLPMEPRKWDYQKALRELDVTEVPFRSMDGNTAGYSWHRELAINPVAKYPEKTKLHELGHIVLGHTTDEQLEVYKQHRGLFEFQAEGVAYIAGHDLELTEHFDAAESRRYVQSWLSGQEPSEDQIRDVFTATDRIIRSGLVIVAVGEAL